MNFSYFIIIRPLNVFLGMLTVFVGALLAGPLSPIHRVVFACVSAGLIMAGANVINDFFDVEIDRVNKPFRPLPAGRIRPRTALIFSTILFALGFFLSIFIQFFSVFVAALTVVGLIVYSAWLKRTFLWGNIAVSFFSALAFVYGALSVGDVKASWIPATFAFFFHLGREIIKDVEDRVADASSHAQTLPILLGERRALIASTVAFAILISFTFIPYALGIYGKGYFWTVLLGVDLVILFALIWMWKRPDPTTLRRVSALLKLDIFVGLIALYLGQAPRIHL
jgi:geranylgeranylglycerol-phosphate geranylgeranyltransferase